MTYTLRVIVDLFLRLSDPRHSLFQGSPFVLVTIATRLSLQPWASRCARGTPHRGDNAERLWGRKWLRALLRTRTPLKGPQAVRQQDQHERKTGSMGRQVKKLFTRKPTTDTTTVEVESSSPFPSHSKRMFAFVAHLFNNGRYRNW